MQRAVADEIENGKLMAMRLSVGYGAEEDPRHGNQANSQGRQSSCDGGGGWGPSASRDRPREPEEYDPFLLLDDFRSDVPEQYRRGFPWHPHRGMETITYVLRGRVENGDSLGHHGVISPGDVQWMSAGSGILHQEMPQSDESGAMYGFQLWTNLPAANKMSEPRYRGIDSAEILEVTDASGATIRIVAGVANGVTGPVRDVVTHPEYLDVRVPAGKTFTRATPRGDTVFAYVIGGQGGLQPPRRSVYVRSGRPPGHALPRSAVSDATWAKIVRAVAS